MRELKHHYGWKQIGSDKWKEANFSHLFLMASYLHNASMKWPWDDSTLGEFVCRNHQTLATQLEQGNEQLESYVDQVINQRDLKYTNQELA